MCVERDDRNRACPSWFRGLGWVLRATGSHRGVAGGRDRAGSALQCGRWVGGRQGGRWRN